MIFHIDLVRNNSDTRYIIKKVSSLDNNFQNYKFKFSIYSNVENIISVKDRVFEKTSEKKHDIDLIINLDDKLINFNFNKYSIKSYKALDELKNSKILDYSLETSWKFIFF